MSRQGVGSGGDVIMSLFDRIVVGASVALTIGFVVLGAVFVVVTS